MPKKLLVLKQVTAITAMLLLLPVVTLVFGLGHLLLWLDDKFDSMYTWLYNWSNK